MSIIKPIFIFIAATIFLIIRIVTYIDKINIDYKRVSLAKIESMKDETFELTDFYFDKTPVDNNKNTDMYVITLYLDLHDSISTVALLTKNVSRFLEDYEQNGKIIVKHYNSSIFAKTYDGIRLYRQQNVDEATKAFFGKQYFDDIDRPTALEYVTTQTHSRFQLELFFYSIIIIPLGIFIFARKTSHPEKMKI